ncbi:MAG TPA: hypothetical protein VD963_02530 [Phycisphaerales bacterium]|nr:hypothetical protein [Phycisphaerales bacterium]
MSCTSHPRRPLRAGLAVATLLAAMPLLGGCYYWSNERDAQYRANPTPELITLYQRRVDVRNALTVTFDENLRMARQDLGRAFYTDRPSRLTREPIPQP